MSDQVFYIKRGDTLPALTATLLEPDGKTPVDLTNSTVVFQMRDRKNTLVLEGDCTVLDDVGGRVEYEWQEGDTDTVGAMRGEFEITSDAGTATAPNYGFFTVNIADDIRVAVEVS